VGRGRKGSSVGSAYRNTPSVGSAYRPGASERVARAIRDDNEGARFPTGGSSHVTVNSTDDPKAPEGGHYVSIGDDNDHSTAVFDSDGALADDVRTNRDWETRDRQN
jgi:hypothetical protein